MRKTEILIHLFFSEKLDNLTSMKAVLGQKGELVTPGWLLNNVMNFAIERK